MADGQLTCGFVSASDLQGLFGDLEICSWEVPLNNTCRIEGYCTVQEVDGYAKYSYRLICSVRRGSGDVSIIYGPSKEQEISTYNIWNGLEITFGTSGGYIVAKTVSPDGEEYRVSCCMYAYSIERML